VRPAPSAGVPRTAVVEQPAVRRPPSAAVTRPAVVEQAVVRPAQAGVRHVVARRDRRVVHDDRDLLGHRAGCGVAIDRYRHPWRPVLELVGHRRATPDDASADPVTWPPEYPLPVLGYPVPALG